MLLVSAHILLFPNQMWCDFKGWGGSVLTDVWKGRLACFFRREGRIKVGGGPAGGGSCGWHADVDIQGTHTRPYSLACARSVMSNSETPWIVPHQAPPSMGFSRQEYWSGVLFPLQGIFPGQGSNPCLLHCRRILCHSATWEVTGPPFTIIEKEKLDLRRGGRVRCTFGPMNQVLQTPS